MLSGLGAAAADATFALAAAFGVSAIAEPIQHHILFIRLVGGSFLAFWGVRIFLSRFAESHPLVKGEGWGGPFWSTVLLTFTNPMTLLAFMAILAGIGDVHVGRHIPAVLLWTAGVCAGSFGWWLLLAHFAHGFREVFNFKVLTLMNQIMGVVVTAAGLAVLMSIRI